jgi:GTP diphosphokinase / guanosine-3',5'-bis(diphosphate) 3'-diphosphatase
MTQKSQLLSVEILLDQVKSYIKDEQSLELIERAFNYANDHHKDQIRKSGEPYINHLLHVASILAELRVGPSTIAAGLLHDVIEDCNVSFEELSKVFDEEIAKLVESVTKIGNIEFKDEKEYMATNHRKIFIAMAKDVRVILIKLVDRLHNMRTLSFMSEEKQKKIAKETLDVYAPIAHRLGISEIKNELEDLAFYYLFPDKYYEIADLIETRKAQRDAYVNTMIQEISELLSSNNIKFRIFGRSKHFYSIYKKMSTKNKRFDEILDLNAIRIITDSELGCYEVLGHIHAKYRPIPGRLKDYIAMPKMNMYQSLHTTIVATGGNIFEIQIRTEDMDLIAERGIAAHYRYKEGTKFNQENSQKEIEERLTWFKDFDNLTKESKDADEYMDILTHDVFEANVYVMSPKGRVIDLPNGATPLDFAYRIHTEVGHSTVGAIVNNVMVPLNTELKTGDVVQIKTSKQSNGPSEDWMKIAKTSHARSKIRNFLNEKESVSRKEMILKGEHLFKEELKRREMDEKEFFQSKRLENALHLFAVKSMDDFYHAIAVKSLSVAVVFEKLNLTKRSLLEGFNLDRIFKPQVTKRTFSKSGIKVKGIDSMMIALAGCCSPVPGDEIVGYITKGQGVKVHRKDCINVRNETKRLIDVEWDEDLPEGKYEVKLYIYAQDRSFLISDIVTVISQCKAGLSAVNSSVSEDKINASTFVSVLVKDAEHLQLVMSNLKKITQVFEVSRTQN